MFNMKIFINFIIIVFGFSLVPIWDFKESSIDLLGTNNNYEYTILESSMYSLKSILKKKIIRNNGKIIHQNYLSVSEYVKNNGDESLNPILTEKEVQFENIESFYKLDDFKIICPQGNHNPIYINTNLNEITFTNWVKYDYWDLKCYYHRMRYFLVYYLINGKNQVQAYKESDKTWNIYNNIQIPDEIYDFKLINKEDEKGTDTGPYAFMAIIKDNNYIKLFGSKYKFNDDGEISLDTSTSSTPLNLIESKSNTKAYFDSGNTTNFYYFTYNDASDFSSGYSTKPPGNDYAVSDSVTYKNNERNPLKFFDEVEINEFNFMSYNKYAYYSIKNKITNKTYHGIFDITLNKIVFNTDKEIKVFIPYSSNSMLAITEESAYRICAIFNANKDDCVDDCSSDQIILDDKGNKCGTTTGITKPLLKPEGVYITSCDTSIYISDGTNCGLCKDIDNSKPYKFINGTECLSSKPDNAEYYNNNNQQLNLLLCKSGYILSENSCTPHCYSSCATCSVYSENEAQQHCLTCKEGYEKESETDTDTNCLLIVDCSPSNSQKCLKCNAESNNLGLCLSCKSGYKNVNYTTLYPQYLDCLLDDNPLLKSFYYDNITEEYKPCYRTCKRCLIGGTPDENNCLECASGYMLRPGDNAKNNCVAYSEYYYYSTNYDQYKGLKIYQCPEEAKYKINNEKSCIDDCTKSEYKYLFNGNCLKDCPSDTTKVGYICQANSNKCSFGENDLYLENNNLEAVTTFVKTYLSEFSYTEKHVTQYTNENYTIVIYKTASCIKELSLKVPNVDFKDCYTKVQNAYNIQENLVVSIADKKGISNPLTFYSFYHPHSGEKLDAETICADDKITIKENLYALLDENNNFYELQTALAEQGINIFDKNDPFYTDICYDFDNPYEKDIPLNDRIKDLYPNVSLCDEGCQYEGINLEDMSAECNCAFNDISNNALIKDNEFLNSFAGEIFDLINSSNILVLKCFKYMFKHFERSIGGWLSLILILAHIAMVLLYFLKEFEIMKNNLLNLTKNYLEYISNKEKENKENNNNPPKKHKISNNNSNKQINDIIISTAFRSETKSDDIKVHSKRLEDPNKEDNKVVLFGSTKQLPKYSKEFNNKIEETQNNLNYDKNLDLFFEEYLATSPDEMPYDDAIVLEKRKFQEHLLECLKEKQIIANTFLAKDELKPRSIKIMVLILNFILYFVVNGLFFSESVISELYEVDDDEEHFFSYFPRSIGRIIYCTIVSIIIGMITDFFFVQQIKLKGIFIREKEDKKILKEKIVELINDIKKRNFAFIITASVILLFSFFYLLCFNYVYPYSQIEWIKSSITIVIIMQLLSALKCLLESGLRYLSFKIKSEKFYKISKMLD